MLAEYAALRLLEAELNSSIQQIKVKAIAEALDIYQGQRQIVYDNQYVKVLLVFRNRYLSEKQDEILASINKRLQAAQIAQAKLVSEQMEHLNAQIQKLQEELASLECQRDALLSNQEIENLKSQQQERLKAGSYKEPDLSCYIKAIAVKSISDRKFK